MTNKAYRIEHAGNYLAGTGAVAGAGPGRDRRWRRDGDQAPPGLPDQYVGHADLLSAELRAVGKARREFEEFAVPSGNLTMQQMVARQVDLGTYAGPLFVIGHDKGDLVAIAMIESVGKTVQRDGPQGS